MITNTPRVIQLEENTPARFSSDYLPTEICIELYRKYGEKINITPPSFKNDYQWELTSRGWAGYIPLTREYGFFLEPKIPLQNLFGMWEYAYRLSSFNFYNDLYSCKSLQDFYEQLANILALRVLDRGRKGLYRTYLPMEERLPYIRGQVDIRRLSQEPWKAQPYCHYQDNTPDIDENQILAWTLYLIARNGLCGEKSAHTVRRAFRNLQGWVSLTPFTGRDCLNRVYNRLNQDYQPLHALSRFFLENSGPQHEIGEQTMLPFLVDMASLFELFVAEWLKIHLPAKYKLKAKERVSISQSNNLYFELDLVLYDDESNVALCILDTKYKASGNPTQADLHQVASYAVTKNCLQAALIYPINLSSPLSAQVGNIRIRNLTFSLAGDLEKSGETFLHELLELL